MKRVVLVLGGILVALTALKLARQLGFPSLPKMDTAVFVPKGTWPPHVPYVPELCIGHTGSEKVTEAEVKAAGGDAFEAINVARSKLPNCGGTINIALIGQYVVTHQLVIPERVSLFFDVRGVYVDEVKAESAIRLK